MMMMIGFTDRRLTKRCGFGLEVMREKIAAATVAGLLVLIRRSRDERLCGGKVKPRLHVQQREKFTTPCVVYALLMISLLIAGSSPVICWVLLVITNLIIAFCATLTTPSVQPKHVDPTKLFLLDDG